MNTETSLTTTVGEIVREQEYDYVYGQTNSSKYVTWSMYDTIEKVYAYLNSTHITGKEDSLGRPKPFFNISIAAANIWMRATDIDRKDIRIKATKQQDWVDAFLATVKIQDWMKRAKFGKFLNSWGRILSRYGSCIVKIIESDGQLYLKAMPWSKIIVDPVDFGPNPKIEPIDLTRAQLYKRVQTHGYDKKAVDDLCFAIDKARETMNRRKKDNKSGFIRIYEVHMNESYSLITNDSKDDDMYVQQMHVISYVMTKSGRSEQFEDFTLYKGREEKDPYVLTHLIEEDDRTLSVGAVEYLFQAQWMQNHTAKSIKDQLDMASKMIFKTTDPRFVGNNFLTDLEQGSVVQYEGELDRLNNGPMDVVSSQNFAVQWKNLGNEIVGVSEAMLGGSPKSGTAWRLQEALLNENYSLFELMTENKGIYLEEIFREFIIPFIKKQLNSSEEVSSVLESYDIDRIDALYIKNYSIKEVKQRIKRKVIDGQPISPEEQEVMIADTQSELREALKKLGDQRFFKPSDFDDKTWQEQLKDIEWNLDFDVTGEQHNIQEMLTTLNTVLQMIMTPGFDQNKKAQAVVGEILNLTGTMSPIKFNAIQNSNPEPPQELENEIPQKGKPKPQILPVA